jgi:hypothetical protein
MGIQKVNGTDTKVWGAFPPRHRRGRTPSSDLADLTGREAITAWGRDRRCAHGRQRVIAVSPVHPQNRPAGCRPHRADRERFPRPTNWSQYDAFDSSLEPVHDAVCFGQCSNAASPPRAPSRRRSPRRGRQLRRRPTLGLRAVPTDGLIRRHPQLQRSVQVWRRYSVTRKLSVSGWVFTSSYGGNPSNKVRVACMSAVAKPSVKRS